MSPKQTHRQTHSKREHLDERPHEPGTEHAAEPAGDPRGPDDGAAGAEADGQGGVEAMAEPAPQAAAEAEAPGREPAGAARADELEAQRDRYLRLAAEFDNFRKRTERERAESWGRAQAQLVERLLDALDDLQRVAHVEPEKTSVAALREGVQLVERKLLRVLESAGLEVVEAEGQPFDPELHEALMSASTTEREADETVAQVFQKGYRFKGNLLRPARVSVNKYER